LYPESASQLRHLLSHYPALGKRSQNFEALFPPLGDPDKTCEKKPNRTVPVNVESWNRSISLFERIVRRKTASHFAGNALGEYL